jgi:ABC-type antimicrobial peptide transport system permease subunit
VVGIARSPLGGQASDVYVPLSELQQMGGRKGRVNNVQVRAASSADVERVQREIEQRLSGASVTTSADLANRVGGSVVDARNLASKLGGALEVIGLLAAFVIATLLTVASVTKRTRELGTLRALGWSRWLVVRQIAAESVVQGLIGGLIGAALGIGGAAVVDAVAPPLHATVGGSTPDATSLTSFGSGHISPGSSMVALHAPVDLKLAGVAFALAALGGLLAGTAGGLRAARLLPAVALRNVE